MHVELVDLFRCPVPHEDAWLVAAANKTVNRVIVQGVLGCPVCNAEYPIVDGVAHFTAARATASGTTARGTAESDTTVDEQPIVDAVGEAETFRTAAQLDLSSPGKTIALIGYDASRARALLDLADCRVVVVNGTTGAFDLRGASFANIRCDDMLPVATASLHGVALRGGAMPANAVQALRADGRLVAPAYLDVPPGTREIARDHQEWVVARDGVTSPPVRLSRRQSSA